MFAAVRDEEAFQEQDTLSENEQEQETGQSSCSGSEESGKSVQGELPREE